MPEREQRRETRRAEGLKSVRWSKELKKLYLIMLRWNIPADP